MGLFARRRGADQAFVEFNSAPTWPDAIRVLVQEPLLLGTAVPELEMFAAVPDFGGLSDDLSEHLSALLLLRRVALPVLRSISDSEPQIAAAAVEVLADIASAEAAGQRFDRHRQLAPLQDAVLGWQKVLASSVDEFLTESGGAVLRRRAGRRCHELYLQTGRLDALEYAAGVLRAALDSAPQAGGDAGVTTAEIRVDLGYVLFSLTAATSSAQYVSDAVTQFETAIADSRGRPYPNAVLGLSAALGERGRPEDIRRAVEVLESVNITELSGDDLATIRSGLANALVARYQLTADERDLNRAVQVLESIGADVPGPKARALARRALAHTLVIRSEAFEFHDDLRRAFALLEGLLADEDPGSLAAADVTQEFILVLSKLYRKTGDHAFLERAVAVGGTALGAGEQDARLVFQLANAMLAGAGRDPIRLNEAVALYQRLVDRPGSSPDVEILAGLASAQLMLHESTGAVSAAEAAVAACVQGMEVSWAVFLRSSPSRELQYDSETWEIFSLTVLCALTLAQALPGRAPEMRRLAMTAADAGQSRLLGVRAGMTGHPAPDSVPLGLARRERILAEELRAIDDAEFRQWLRPVYGARGNTENAPDDASRKKQELLDMWEEIEHCSPDASAWVSRRRGDPVRWADIAALARPDVTVLSFAESASELVAFVLRNGAPEPAVVNSGISMTDLETCVTRLQRDVGSPSASRPEMWDAPLVRYFEVLREYSEGDGRVVLAPVSVSWLIPWSAVAYRAGWRSPGGTPVALVTVPGLRAFGTLALRPASDGPEVTVVGDAQGNLAFAAAEAQMVAARLGADCLLGEQASSAAVLPRMYASRLIHLATHARFDPDSPLDSGIVLADGTLTCRQIIATSLNADLVVLSACETGAARSLGGNELAGLGQAFLYAGARSVVLSLWQVNDEATSLLMTEFYAELFTHGNIALALARAQENVRSHDRWRHVRYWGAFVLIGAESLPRDRGNE